MSGKKVFGTLVWEHHDPSFLSKNVKNENKDIIAEKTRCYEICLSKRSLFKAATEIGQIIIYTKKAPKET